MNVIPPKALIVESLKKKKFTQLTGLEFKIYDEIGVAKYLLSRPAIEISEIAPKDKILVYQFTEWHHG